MIYCYILALKIIIVFNSEPSLTVTVNNADNAVAGQSHTLSCSVTGSNLETATIMYTWRLGINVLQGPSTSNMYNITMVQVSNAGDVYTCEVTVTVSYWDVSGSFGNSGSGTLSVTSEYLHDICICGHSKVAIYY